MEIFNQDLKETHLPEDITNWRSFAASFNGYQYCGGNAACGELANNTAGYFEENGKLPDLSLGDLRACLFFEYRRDHFTNWGGDPEMLYIQTLLDQIRLKIRNENSSAENRSQVLQEMTSETHPLRVDFLQSEKFPLLNLLGLTFAPGKKQKSAMSGSWNRNMYQDMLRLREFYHADLQVSLLEHEEFGELGLDGFEGQSQRRGMSLIKHPIRDVSVPRSLKEFAQVIREIVRHLSDGKTVVVHCKGGLGRTGLTAACAAVAASNNRINANHAIKIVRQARPGAVETTEQEKFVSFFEEYWQIYNDRIESLLKQQKRAVPEKVLEIKSKGLIERLFRFSDYEGKYFFYLTNEYPFSINDDNYDWRAEPVPTFTESLDLLSNSYQFVPYKKPFVHPKYLSEFKEFLEKVFKNTESSLTIEKWFAGEDDPAHIFRAENDVNNSGEQDEPTADVERDSVVQFNSRSILKQNVITDGKDVSAEAEAKKRKIIKIKFDDTLIEAKNIPELYQKALLFLVDNNHLKEAEIPVSSGPTRYLLAKEPKHPSGKNFFAPVEYLGFYLEAHNNRPTAIRQLKNLFEDLQIKFEQIGEDLVSVEVNRRNNVQAQHSHVTAAQRVTGSMMGLAIGDSLGTTVEFKPTGTFPKITTIIGGGPFNLNAGEWTDDTSMALCLADSLIESKGFDAADQMRRYCRWKNEGYLSSNGTAFDIGNTVRQALDKFEKQVTDDGAVNPFCGSVSPASAGNGSLMRLAPVPLYFANDPENAIFYAGESSRTTHGTRECVDACRYYAGLIIGAVQGRTKEEILSSAFAPVAGLWETLPLSPKVAHIAGGSFKASAPPQISGAVQGYVIPSLHAALWAFYHTNSFAAGALKVVNLGYDADTYGAIYGQLAGAFYGFESIPQEWRNLIVNRELIKNLAGKLIQE